ncbi:glycerol kinase GlpK [Christensenella tenuis]|uniref:Glycerol kinase n=1 Tax=Christensenella tenuis TaxID=2763033 RepID=A0ABR7EI02_9FIRM|nr:glycerol kinase GlpK [Christensenella tenuis]MBC5649407.1 glycerol kinase GlpK [Christensenella tenuis]
MKRYVIALDQGTTSSRCIIFDQDCNIICVRQREFTQHFPQDGWVEHDPMEIVSSQVGVLEEAVDEAGIFLDEVAGIGITNQRETTIVWEKETGKPVYNAIVWQCRRTAAICEQLKQDGMADYIRETTGLLIDAYFSATKVKWILDHVEGARKRAEKGELLFGTVDTWLLWNLTRGKVHVTDYTNASRTMMFNIRSLKWDETILKALGIPRAMLPEVKSSSELYGYAEVYGKKIPVAGIAGDQQSALFGQACFGAGQAKNTYGTGCFMLMNTGEKLCRSKNGLLTTIAATPKGTLHYAIEGSVFMGGAVIQWLRDEMRLIQASADSEYFAQKVPDNGGVYLVPAFTGLGAPYWDMYARGTIIGLTRGATAEHIIRAALESIAYQTKDVLDAMQADTKIKLGRLKVDGGASANNFLMQFQADITETPVMRPRVRETTALGAAYLAGLATGVWKSTEEISGKWTLDKRFAPAMPAEKRERLIRHWHKAVSRAKGWQDT